MTEDIKRLTAEDPIDSESLKTFNSLESARYEIGIQLLNTEQERVKLLATAHQVDQQRQRMFEKILVERGLPPNTQVEIDATTGKLTLLKRPAATPAPAVT